MWSGVVVGAWSCPVACALVEVVGWLRAAVGGASRACWLGVGVDVTLGWARSAGDGVAPT